MVQLAQKQIKYADQAPYTNLIQSTTYIRMLEQIFFVYIYLLYFIGLYCNRF